MFDCRLGVVEDKPPAEDSAMFVYPFSNVGGFHLCTGNNVLPVYKKTSALANLPGYLLQLPNNTTVSTRRTTNSTCRTGNCSTI